jgi:hypothetical protein
METKRIDHYSSQSTEKDKQLIKLTSYRRRFHHFFQNRRFSGRFRGLLEGTASPSDADESKPNKFTACLGFLLAASTPAREAFSAALSPEDFAASFTLHFKGLAKAIY